MAITKWKRWMLDKKPPSTPSKQNNKLALDLRTVLVLAEVQDETQMIAVEKFLSLKSARGKDVSCVMISSNKRLQSEYIIDHKSVRWTGEPTGAVIDSILTKEYDVMYLPNATISITTEYVLKYCKAKIKTGVYNEGTIQYLDISVDNDKGDFAQVFKEIDAVLVKLIGNG